jgi:hypothetical protein
VSQKKVNCPECGGITRFNPAMKRIVCESCGLSITRDELDNMKDKLRDDIAYYDDRQQEKTKFDTKKRRNDDYLNWWTSEHKPEE